MKIDIGSLDLERFHINPRSITGIGDFVLIVPHKAMWEWDEKELHLRSLLCRPDGEVVSAGFPKFFNFSERHTHDAVVIDGINRGISHFPGKADGSLIIRSVIDGHVHFRTRGCETIASDMDSAVRGLIAARYPRLLDAKLSHEKQSFLMEYVAPSNQIVVRYDEPRLIGLGYSDWSSGELCVRRMVENVFNVDCIDNHDDVASDIDVLRQRVSAFDDKEGIVVWTHVGDGNYHLSKLKSAWYMRLHALRSQATPRYLKEFCYLNDVSTLDGLKNALLKEGFDWEVCSYMEPLWDEISSNVSRVDELIERVESEILTRRIMELQTRKEIALACKQLDEDLQCVGHDGCFAYAISRAVGEIEKASEIRDAMRLDISVAQLRLLKKQGLEKLGSTSFVDEG